MMKWKLDVFARENVKIFCVEGSKGGAVVRALASHQCGPGSNPGVDAICGFSLLLVLSLAPRGFSPGTLFFPSPQKPTFPNSNSTRNQVDEEPLCGCATCKSSFFYLFIYLIFRMFVFCFFCLFVCFFGGRFFHPWQHLIFLSNERFFLWKVRVLLLFFSFRY